jgi:outer membrane protein OmpA-like peptidoglycan-associated protein
MNNQLGNKLLAAALALTLGACAGAPKQNMVLESARTAVQSAQSDPNVSQYAALDLAKAKEQLQLAEAAAAKHKLDEVAQYAYLASQSAHIAQAHGAAQADDAHVANGQAERDRVAIEARTRETETAKAQTEQARAQTEQAQAQTATAVEQRDQARAEMEQLKATQTSRGLMMTLGDVLFDTGRSELKSGATRKLDQLAQFLRAHPSRRVQVDGFTDSVGSDALNETLSQHRADSVKAELVSRGIDPAMVGSQGYGKAFPVAGNDAPSGRQLNRRVEVVISNADNAQIAPRSAAMIQ